jgi:XTP/dITP diphosphohydrolase
MKKKLLFATHNKHKFEEVKAALGDKLELVSLEDINFKKEIPETGNTLEANALEKARYVHKITGMDCFADDTGLEVDILNGAPGVYSARFAGEKATYDDNTELLLKKLKDKEARSAHFRTVFALIWEGKEFLFEGVVKGEITTGKRGNQGFGYDPVFLPEGKILTFAEMGLDEKNKISHRAKALKSMTSFFQ